MIRRTKTITNVYVELEGFDEFIDKLGRLAKGDFVNPAFRKYVEHVRQVVIEGTPVGHKPEDEHPGLMKKSWQEPVYNVGQTESKATITNSVEYGVAENYGHYQSPGLYVPEIGRELVHSYVPGTYALETSLQEAELNFESIIKPEILAVWNDYKESKDYRGVKYFTVRQSYYDKPGEELQ